ncbi:hypothetical protein Unana1_00627 [Umbelopsis nana]
MIFCVLTVRIYRSELRASERTEEYYDSMKEHMDEEYDTRPVYPLIEKQDFERDIPGEDAQPEFYESRSAIYSKISHKKNLKKSNTLKLNEDNLHPPAHSIRIKSPTVEKLDYDSFRGHRTGEIPLERQSVTFRNEQLTSNASEATEQEDSNLLEK